MGNQDSVYRVYSVAEIRAIETDALAMQADAGNADTMSLMQKAGLAAAHLAAELLTQAHAKILVLAGPGNNGGDAFEVAALLSAQGHVVHVLQCGETANYSSDALSSRHKAQAQHVQFIDTAILATLPADWALIIDGLFGIGLKQAPEGSIASLIRDINKLAAELAIPLLALDVPSGLNADTGQVTGADGIAVCATHTISFIGNKTGLHTGAGRDYAGEVSVATLDIPANFFPPGKARLNTAASLKGILQPRKQNSHKGSYGDVIIIGGASGMVGAAILAARAAQFSGAGRIYCGIPGVIPLAPSYDSLHPEIMFRSPEDMDFHNHHVVIGPGLGTSASVQALLTKAIKSAKTLVVDADALNLIAADAALAHLLAARTAASVLTPHPLEAARLLQQGVAEVQADRLLAARKLAQQLNTVVVLKGSGSIICEANGDLSINTTGNPALASGGTGDVLAGVTGALLAQGCTAAEAARIAVWAHAYAADELVAQGVGPIGLTASELLPVIRQNLNLLTKR
ncbi:NAD(P)H-hydrate dehydratase [Undibacterium sp. CY18W]|uniref:Bifunctional NAD(P)H-hydrate repair enzyme n=2 Tax=Undibacterium hunanense TaxID=2762292 RepID=A0ABR6ZND1_9BURK|nr:NAD(P)H-hydrate dehydratase [Undibacterium hunanense]